MQTQLPTAVNARKLLYLAPLAGLVAAVLNAVLFFIGSSMGAFPADVLIPNAGKPLTLGPVIFSSIVPSLLAGVVFFLLARFTKKPLRIFNMVAIVLLILSFATPFTIPNVPVAMAVFLELMHVVVAGAVLVAFNKYAKL